MYEKGEEMKNLSITVEDEVHQKVKVEAARKGKNIREFLLELIDGYFQKCKEDKENAETDSKC